MDRIFNFDNQRFHNNLINMPPNPNTVVLTPHMSSHLNGPINLGHSFYKSEANRLSSYGGFPNPFVEASKLAAAGFYYSKNRDLVICAFCNIQIGSWEQGDDPLSEHKRWSSSCPFLNGLDVGNIPMNRSNSSSPTDTPRSYDECGLYGITPVDPSVTLGPLERLGITRTVRAQHPEYMTLDNRLKSFELWPMALQPRPEALATAGFFYTGQGDRCVCFQCGGGLKDWSDSDDPWVEHAKFYPLCTHVIRTKGDAFISSCRPEPVPDPSVNTSSSTTETQSTESTAPQDVATSSDTQASLLTSSVQTSAQASTQAEQVSTQAEPQASTSRIQLEERPESLKSNEVKGDAKPAGTECTNQETKEDESTEVLLCKICFQQEKAVAFLPCGHVVACESCAPSLQHCAVCRKRVTATFRVYIA